MITDLQLTRNNIAELASLEDTRYENIFKMARSDKYFFYNIIKKISFPDDLNPQIFFEVRVTANMPWTSFSNQVYGNQNLWWLICLANNIQNPVNNPVTGDKYTVIKPTYVNRILSEINQQV